MAQLTSFNAYDGRGSFARAQLVSAGDQALPSLEVGLSLSQDASNQVALVVSGGVLRAILTVAGTSQELAGATFSTATQYLRLRTGAGTTPTTFWEHSADGVSYTLLHSAADSFSMSQVRASLFARTTSAEPTSTTAVWDNFNFP
jgi:hypothetical protein